jgi:hypothetical protein
MTRTTKATQKAVSNTDLLPAERFTLIASKGLGRMSASTAHSTAYFRGSLYLGTSCGNPVMAEDAPRILRYDPGRSEWLTVYESPLVDPVGRELVADRTLGKLSTLRRGKGPLPRYAGYRSMCVFQGKSDDAPALYVSAMSRSGASILRSADGETF